MRAAVSVRMAPTQCSPQQLLQLSAVVVVAAALVEVFLERLAVLAAALEVMALEQERQVKDLMAALTAGLTQVVVVELALLVILAVKVTGAMVSSHQ